MKRCPECGETKPLDEFHKSAAHNGVSPRCKPCAIKVSSVWYAENKDRKRAYDEKRRVEKRDLYRAASKRFRENNVGKKKADTQMRRAAQALRLPVWADKKAIRGVYVWASRVSKCTGLRFCVDHVLPLRGKSVSGLHVVGNLAVIPEGLNLLKGAK